MKPKKAIKLIKSVCDLFKLAIELENKQAERLANTSITDYKLKKHSYNYEKYSDEKKEETTTYILDTGEKIYLDDSQIEWNAKLLDALSNKGFIVKRPATFSEAFEKAKTEDPVLKEAYDEIEKSLKPKVSRFQQKLNEAMEQAKKAKEQ